MATRTVRIMAFGIVLLGLITGALLYAKPEQSSGAQSAKRAVRMEITGPKEIPAAFQITAREGETAAVEVTNVGKFGFEPSFKKDESSVVLVTIFDAAVSPNKRLGQVAVPADGKQRVQSKTSPDFGIRIVRIIEPK